MADKKISQLTDLPAASVSPSNDVLAIVDTNVTETKKITAKALVDGALNAGTANGLVYLNGSKETTTGSIITYDGTTFKVDDAVVINESGGDNDTRIEGDTDANLFFVDASADKIGLGNSSPLGKLTISYPAGANAPTTVTAANTYLQLGSGEYGASNNGKFMIGFGYTDALTNTNSPAYIGYEEVSTSGDTFGNLTFYTRSVTTDTAPDKRMTLDSSGNLGLGVTPTTSTVPTFNFGTNATGALFVTSGATSLGSNVRFNGGYQFVTSSSAGLYQIAGNTHYWFNAASGTAGNTISFTQAMTLDASGNLLVGTTSSPSYGSKLRVEGGIESFSSQFNVVSGTSTQFELVNRSASAGFDFYVNSGGTLAARITSGGDLLVGTTSAEGNGMTLTSGSGNYVFWTTVSTTNQKDHYRLANPNGQVASIYTSGSSGGLYNLSDQRAKKNIVDAPSALQSILDTKIRSFDWIVDDVHQEYGGIAQEFQLTIPEAVITPSDEGAMLAIDWAKPIPRLIKAIQEQQAMIKSLEAKVAALESK